MEAGEQQLYVGLCYGLNSVPPPQKICWSPRIVVLDAVPQSMTLFGERVFTEVIKLK